MHESDEGGPAIILLAMLITVFVKPGLNPTTFSSVEMTEVLGEEGWEEHMNLPQVMMIVIKMMMRRKMVMMV